MATGKKRSEADINWIAAVRFSSQVQSIQRIDLSVDDLFHTGVHQGDFKIWHPKDSCIARISVAAVACDACLQASDRIAAVFSTT